MPAQAIINGWVAIDGELHDADQLLAHARRWRYVRDNHARAHCPHMDGTFYWRFTSIPAVRARTVDEVVDRAMRGEIDR